MFFVYVVQELRLPGWAVISSFETEEDLGTAQDLAEGICEAFPEDFCCNYEEIRIDPLVEGYGGRSEEGPWQQVVLTRIRDSPVGVRGCGGGWGLEVSTHRDG